MMKSTKDLEDIIERLVQDISESVLPDGLVDSLEDICEEYEYAQKITYSYFKAEKDIEVKHLLALALIGFMINDTTLRQFLTSRGWTQEDFDDVKRDL